MERSVMVLNGWKKGIPHLYNLADDIHEDNDISTNHPEIVKQMIEIIKKEQWQR